MTKLTPSMIKALRTIAEQCSESGSGWSWGKFGKAGQALDGRGLVQPTGRIGDFFHPRQYRLTDAGRAALAKLDSESAKEQGDE